MRFTVPLGVSALLALPLNIALAQSEIAVTQATPSQPLRVRLLRAPEAPSAPIAVLEDVTAQADSRGVIGVYLDAGSDQPGAPIGSLIPGSAAEEAGLQAGDRILAIDGEKVATTSDLMDAMKGRKAGESVALKIDRDGWRKRVELTLGAAEEQGARFGEIAEIEEYEPAEELIEEDELGDLSELIELHVQAHGDAEGGDQLERHIWINGKEASDEEVERMGIHFGSIEGGEDLEDVEERLLGLGFDLRALEGGDCCESTEGCESDDDCCETDCDEGSDECEVECELEWRLGRDDDDDDEHGFFGMLFGDGDVPHGMTSEVRVYVEGPDGFEEFDDGELRAMLEGHRFGQAQHGAHGGHASHSPHGAHDGHGAHSERMAFPQRMRGMHMRSAQGAPHDFDAEELEANVREWIEQMHEDGPPRPRRAQGHRARAPRSMRQMRVSAPDGPGHFARRGRPEEFELREIHARHAERGHAELEELREVVDELREELDDLRDELRRLRRDR